MQFTGDLACITRDGQIFLCGRIDDKIKRMGQFVSLTTLTKTIEEIFYVEQCCTVFHGGSLVTFVKLVVGESSASRCNTEATSLTINNQYKKDSVITDRKNGRFSLKSTAIDYAGYDLETGLKTVNSQLKTNKTILEADIQTYVRSRLSCSYLPDFIQFVDIIPITKNGKSDSKSLIRDYENEEKRFCTVNITSLRDIYCLALNLEADLLEKESEMSFVELGGDSFAALFVVNRLVDLYSPRFTINGSLYEETLGRVLTSSYRDFVNYFGVELFESKNIGENNVGENNVEVIFKSSMAAGLNKRRLDDSGGGFDNSRSGEIVIPVAKCCREELNTGSEIPRQDETHLVNKGFYKDFYAVTSQNKILVGGAENDPRFHERMFADYCFATKDRVDAITLTVKCKQNLGKCIDASPLVVNSTLLGDPLVLIGCHSRRFVSMTMEGVLKWELKTNDRIESSATITSDGRFCVFGCYDGYIYFIDIQSGSIHWKYKTNDIVKSSPISYITTAINGHKLSVTSVAAHDKYLHFLDHLNRKVLWKTPTNSLCCSSPLVDTTENTLYVTLLSGKLIAFDSASGRQRWEFEAGKPIFTSPTFCHSKTRIVFGCVDHFLYCVKSKNGTLVWTFETGGHIFSSPVCLKQPRNSNMELISFGSNDGSLYVLNEDGGLVWKTSPECTAPIVSSPAVLFVPCKRSRKRPLDASRKQSFFNGLSEPSFNVFMKQNYENGLSTQCSESIDQLSTLDCVNFNGLSKKDNGTSKRDYENFNGLSKKDIDINNASEIIDAFPKSLNDDLIVQLLFCIDTKGKFHMFDLLTGKRVDINGLVKCDGEVFSSPVVIGNRIIVGSRDDFLYFIEASC